MDKKIINIYTLILVLLVLHISLAYNVHNEGKTFYDNRIKDGKTNQKVYDIGMKYIPDMSENKILENIANWIVVILILVFRNVKLLIKFIKLILIIIMIRHIFTTLTILPKDKNCKDDKFDTSNLIFGHCYDKIFSGHYASVLLIFLIAYDMKLLTNIGFMIANLVIYAILLIALRFHYTIDIAVSIIVTTFVFVSLKDI
jgi:hypothetical protein